MTNGQVSAGAPRIFGFGIYLIVLNIILLYLLLRIWPSKIPPPDPDTLSLLWGGWLEIGKVSLEARYLLIVMVAAALGSYVHLATSFADYVGARKLVWSWGWWYVLRPFIGMALGVIVYFALRAGLLVPSSGAEALNPYGVAAITGMAGMFSKQATDKLREVFENVFGTQNAPPRTDGL